VNTKRKITAKPPQPAKAWEAGHQKEALQKLLAILQPNKSISSQTQPGIVEYYYVSDIIPFVVSRIGKLTNRPSTKSQLHDAIKNLLMEDPVGASAPPVDAVYLFCKLLSEGLISVSVKQEVCYFHPPITTTKKEEFAVPEQNDIDWEKKKSKFTREEARTTLKKVDKKVASMLKTAWRSRQLSWKRDQQTYFEKNHKELEDTSKYKTLQPHYQRVKQWMEKILQKKKDQHKEPSNNNNNEEKAEDSDVSIEFHTHSTTWNFLHTLIKLFRVTRKIDDKLVEELVEAMISDGLLKIEEEDKVKYVNKPPQKPPGVPPITPRNTSLFAATPGAFWEHHRVSVSRANVVNAQTLATLLRLVGNPSTTVTKSGSAVPAPTASPVPDTTRKEGNIFATLAEEIDAATGKPPRVAAPEPEAPKPVASAPKVKETKKEATDPSEFTSVSSRKKKVKKEKEPEATPSPAPSTKPAASVATTSTFAVLAMEEGTEKEPQPKKKMSSKKKKAAAAAALAEAAIQAAEEPAPEQAPKEAPKEKPAKGAKATNPPAKPGKAADEQPPAKAATAPVKTTAEAKGKAGKGAQEPPKPAEPAKGAKATNPPAKAKDSKAPAKAAEAPKSKGKVTPAPKPTPAEQPSNENPQPPKSKPKKAERERQVTKPSAPKFPVKKKNPPLVPPTLIISCLFVFVLIILAYVLRIDQFLDTLFD